MKRLLVLSIGAALLLAIPASHLLLQQATAAAEKVAICHIEGLDGVGHGITVAGAAVDQHVDHHLDCVIGEENCSSNPDGTCNRRLDPP